MKPKYFKELLSNIAAADSSTDEIDEDQFWLQNCSGHFALTNLLLDTMRSTAKDSGIQGRIVIVSGGVYAKFTPPGGIIFEQLVGSKK